MVFLLFYQGRVALRKRPDRGLLAGLWEYPNDLAPAEGLLSQYDIQTEGEAFGGTGTHIFTHVEWHMTARVAEAVSEALPEGWVWAGRADWSGTYAIPSAFAPFRDLVEERLI